MPQCRIHLSRQVFDNALPTVEYSLTKEGSTLETVLNQLQQWSQHFVQQEQKNTGKK